MSIATMSEQDWQTFKQAYKGRLTTFIIPVDPTPGVVKGLLSRIDAFFSEARVELAEIDAQKEKITAIIREWERVKISGSNDMLRKKNASEAIQQYQIGDGEVVNLYEVERNLIERYSFLKSIIDVLESKQSRLITVTGVMKLEKELSPHATI